MRPCWDTRLSRACQQLLLKRSLNSRRDGGPWQQEKEGLARGGLGRRVRGGVCEDGCCPHRAAQDSVPDQVRRPGHCEFLASLASASLAPSTFRVPTMHTPRVTPTLHNHVSLLALYGRISSAFIRSMRVTIVIVSPTPFSAQHRSHHHSRTSCSSTRCVASTARNKPETL